MIFFKKNCRFYSFTDFHRLPVFDTIHGFFLQKKSRLKHEHKMVFILHVLQGIPMFSSHHLEIQKYFSIRSNFIRLHSIIINMHTFLRSNWYFAVFKSSAFDRHFNVSMRRKKNWNPSMNLFKNFIFNHCKW